LYLPDVVKDPFSTRKRMIQSRPFIFTILMGVLLLGACGPGETVIDDRDEPDRVDAEQPDVDREDPETADIELDQMDEEERMLFETRSRLEDQFATRSHDMPESFFSEFEEAEIDPYQGFRIQLLSTRNVELADTTRAEFDEWASNHLDGYVPRSYVHYRQPFYRVRIGDFHSRRRAIEMSRLVQQRFPDAWIVYDRVQPFRVPADTVEFRIGEPTQLSPEVFDDIEMMIDMDGELDPAQQEVDVSNEDPEFEELNSD
jgi:hypothetical protein